jgi:hypothetical protein
VTLGVLAVAGIAAALVLPSMLRPDCPPPGSGIRCEYTTEMRPWLRFLIGTAAVLPLVLRLGYRHHAGPWVAIPLWVLVTAGAVLLIARRGLVEARGGDCSAYPRCYTPGHPYVGVALAMVLAATAVAFWLWDKRAGPTERHHEDVVS